MRAFSAWIAIVPVWQCLAADCSDAVGSCTAKQASLMQLKSSNLKKQGLVLDTEGSFSSKLAGFQKFTDEMVAKYGASSAESPSQGVLDAVATVLDFIDDLNVHLHSAHDDDVELAKGCSAHVQHCFDSFMNATIIEEIKSYKEDAGIKELTHETCRSNARTPCHELCAPNGACDNYDDFRGESGGEVPSLPGCVALGHLNDEFIRADEADDKDKLDKMESCLTDMKKWLDGQMEIVDDGLYEKYDLCKRNNNDCEKSVDTCDKQQGEFNSARCLYAMESNLRCGGFHVCYTESVNACATDCDQIAIRASAREADNETGQRLVCLLAVLFGERDPERDAENYDGTGFLDRPSAADRPGELDKCKSATLLTKDWNIDCPADADGNPGPAFPDVPIIPGFECPVDDVTSPCSSEFLDDWTTDIYGTEQPWSTVLPNGAISECSDIAKRGLHAIALPCAEAGACLR